MSNLLSKASILLTPTATSDGKLHNIKPNTTTGDFDFTRGTAATRVNSNGVIESVASGLPRIDFTGGTGQVLLEPASTNLFLNSATLSTQDVTTSANVFTVSFYGTGSITLSGTHSATLNGTGTNNRVSLSFTPSSGSLTCTVSGTVTNAQIEQKSFATSYIETSGTSATRNQEEANSSGNTSLINSTEGVLYGELASFTNSGEPERNISLSNSTANNTAEIGYSSGTNLARFRLRANNVTILAQNSAVSDTTEFIKIAIKYKSGEIKCFINGNQVISDTTSFAFSESLSELAFDRGNGSNKFNGKIKSIAVFKEALTDAQLISLTS